MLLLFTPGITIFIVFSTKEPFVKRVVPILTILLVNHLLLLSFLFWRSERLFKIADFLINGNLCRLSYVLCLLNLFFFTRIHGMFFFFLLVRWKSYKLQAWIFLQFLRLLVCPLPGLKELKHSLFLSVAHSFQTDARRLMRFRFLSNVLIWGYIHFRLGFRIESMYFFHSFALLNLLNSDSASANE